MALSTLILLKYHNYYSRRFDHCSKLQDYYDNGGIRLDVIKNYNFKLNNGITTSVILNDAIDLENSLQADYLIECDNSNNIKSTWYIISILKIRDNQYQLTLQRDVVNDFYKYYFNKDSLISRCLLPEDSKYIFNKENLNFNQIKKNEILLKDRSNCGWLVGYLPAKLTEEEVTITANTLDNNSKTDYIFSSINAFEYKNIAHPFNNNNQKIKRDGNKIIVDFKLQDKNIVEKVYRFIYDEDAQKIIRDDERAITGDVTINNNFSTSYGNRLYEISYSATTAVYVITKSAPYDFDLIAGDIEYTLLTRLLTYKTTDITTSVIDFKNNYNDYNGRTAKVANNKYKIELIKNGFGAERVGIENANIDSTFETTVLDLLNRDTILDYATQLIPFNSGSILPSVAYNTIYFNFGNLYKTITTTIPADSARQHCYDSGGFDIFCLPYSDNLDFDQTLTSNKFNNLAIANAIMTNFSGQSIDLQILPYCPIINQISDGSIATDYLSKSEIKDGTNIIGYLFWLNTANFELECKQSCGSNESKKILNETKMWRLCSPNYASQFEFNIAKLDKQAGPFTVDVSLKPYNPYIRVAPKFSDLYGKDFNDKRGLILAGDFSLPLASSAWASYELSNKNYEKTFNREIESLEYQNKWSLAGDISNAIVGTAAGYALGAKSFGSIGGVIGGSLAAGGGVLDIFTNQSLRNESINKQKDLFKYQLDNIKAMPSTINKGTPLDINFKIWPLVEEYSASDEEIEEFKKYIKYRGMTANIVDTIDNVKDYKVNSIFDFDYRYIEGLPLELENIGNYELAQFLANELQNGIYIKKGA